MGRNAGTVDTAENDATGMRSDQSADQIEERRFTGPIGTDDRRDGVPFGGERHSVHRTNTAERHPEIADFENRRHRACLAIKRSIRGLTSPINPFGRKITTAMNSRPTTMRWFAVIEPTTDLSTVRMTPP